MQAFLFYVQCVSGRQTVIRSLAETHPTCGGFSWRHPLPILRSPIHQKVIRMFIRNSKLLTRYAMALLAGGLTGCAATISQEGLEQRTSAAIGRSVGTFTITKTGEEAGGRINYTARTRDGLTYQCYMYSATGFQKAMSFGQTPNSDAICSQMGRAAVPSASDGKPAACNPLLKAANRC